MRHVGTQSKIMSGAMLVDTSLAAFCAELDSPHTTYATPNYVDGMPRAEIEHARREWLRLWGLKMRQALSNSPVHGSYRR